MFNIKFMINRIYWCGWSFSNKIYKKPIKIQCYFELWQKQDKMETYLSYMKIIADNFLSCVKTVKINTKHPQNRLRTISFDGNQKLIDTDQDKNGIEKKNQIHDKRTMFTWNYLYNFIDN